MKNSWNNTKERKEWLRSRDRHKDILKAAIETAKEVGYQKVTRRLISEKANVSNGLVRWYMGDIPEIKLKIISMAIEEKELTILGQALAANDAALKNIPKSLKNKVIKFLSLS